MYRLTASNTIQFQLENGGSLFLPATNNGTLEWRSYQAWLNAGNTPETIPLPPVDTRPKFDIFLNQILASNLYQAVVAQAITNPVVNTGLTVTMGALLLAVGGSPNIDGLQAGIDLLFSGLTTTPEQLAELQSILVDSSLNGLISLPTP
jgi:hypothetical protein